MPGNWMARVCQSIKDRMVKFNKRRSAVAGGHNKLVERTCSSEKARHCSRHHSGHVSMALPRSAAAAPAETSLTALVLVGSRWRPVCTPTRRPLMTVCRSIACALIREPRSVSFVARPILPPHPKRIVWSCFSTQQLPTSLQSQ